MDFLTSTLVSGLVYDLVKLGTMLTAKKIQEFFVENFFEITQQQAIEIYSKSQDIPKLEFENLSRNEFISKYEKNFQLSNSEIISQNFSNSNNSGNIIRDSQVNFNNSQKKTD